MRLLKNQRGSMTVDYMFAFFLVSGLSVVIMAFSATLSMVEVVQYMTFASARNYFAGNVSEARQKEAANRKFFELKDNPVVAPILSGGWFAVRDDSFVADFNIPAKYPDFKGYSPNPDINLFHGVIVSFQANVLDFNVPFFGGTKRQDGSTSTSFQTFITSFLGREPSFEECHEFNRLRWQGIKSLANKTGAENYAAAQNEDAYVVINDNGC